MPESSPLDKIGAELTAIWNDILSVAPSASLAELWKEHISIRERLEQIAVVQKAEKFSRPERLEHLDAFLAWAKEVGIQNDDVKIDASENGKELGLRATDSLQPGTVAVVVPQSALLSADYAEQCPSLKAILENDEMIKAMDNIGLLIVIAHEILRGAESKWAPFLNIIPATFPTPIFYTLDQLQALKPSPIFEEALILFRSVARQFVYFYLRIIGEKKIGTKNNKISKLGTPIFTAGPFTPENFTFDFYRWCVSAVSTRINLLPSAVKKESDGSPKRIPALIPFVDMANHKPNTATIFFQSDTNAVNLQLQWDVAKGEEVSIYYGPRTNLKFLLHNGFVPPLPNYDNFYELRLGMPKSANSVEKMARLNKLNIPDSQSIFTFILDPVKFGVRSFRESALWEFAKTFVADKLSEIGTAENEEKAWKFLSDRVRLLLRGYDKIVMDEAAVAAANDATMISIWRLQKSEQEILKAFLELLEKDK